MIRIPNEGFRRDADNYADAARAAEERLRYATDKHTRAWWEHLIKHNQRMARIYRAAYRAAEREDRLNRSIAKWY